MLPEYVAALGFTTARKLSEEASTDDDEGFVLPFWAIIALIVLIIVMINCSCTCFVIRCFAPEVTQGPAWEINSYGTQWVKGVHPGDDKAGSNPVVNSHSYRSYPGGIPVHDPKRNVYDKNNPHHHMRPENYQDRNEPGYAKERQEVLDRLNGLHLAHGGGRLHKNSEIRRQTAVS